MNTLAYYNGIITELADGYVPFCDRVSFFGDGVYDATYAYCKTIFNLDEHLTRLYKSAGYAKITPTLCKDELALLCEDLVKKVVADEVMLYVQFTRGTTIPRNHVFDGEKSNLWITVTPKTITPPDKKMRLITARDVRYDMCYVKTLNLLPNVLASINANNRGCDESVFVQDGVINECAHSNIHLLEGGKIITPSAGKRVLGGIARNNLLNACKRLNIPYEERHFTLTELLNGESAYITSAGTLLSPVVEIDGQKIRENTEITEKLQNALYGEFYAKTRR